jgi:hypothetical protein
LPEKHRWPSRIAVHGISRIRGLTGEGRTGADASAARVGSLYGGSDRQRVLIPR